MGRPRTSTDPRAEAWRKKYQESKISMKRETDAELSEAFQRAEKFPPQRHEITWLEMSAGKSNS